MLDDVELRELRIFLAVLVAAIRETGAQRSGAGVRAGCPLPWPASPSAGWSCQAVSSEDVRTAVRQFRNARPERAAGSHGPGDVVVSVAVPGREVSPLVAP
jgi:hypothetical protein